MRKAFIAALAAVLLISTTTTALAPSKPKEITTFGPVIITDLDIRDYWSTPRPSVDRPRAKIKQPKPIIIDLTPPESASHNRTTVADAKLYALTKLGSVQFACIDKIFTRESNWRVKATNATSGAYGIPQALPGSKMAVIADDWRTNPVTQVKWGIKYVNGRYGSACDAWRFHQNNGWY